MDLEYILSNALRRKEWPDYIVALLFAAGALVLGVVLLGASQNNGVFMGMQISYVNPIQADIAGMAFVGLTLLAVFACITYAIFKGLER